MDDTEARLRQLIEQAIASKDQAEIERVLAEFRSLLEDRIAAAKIALDNQFLLLRRDLP